MVGLKNGKKKLWGNSNSLYFTYSGENVCKKLNFFIVYQSLLGSERVETSLEANDLERSPAAGFFPP